MKPLYSTLALLVALSLGAFCPGIATAQSGQPPFVRPTLAPSVQALASPERDAVVAVIESFLRSEDFFDVSAWDAAFHPDARGWDEAMGEAGHEGWEEYQAWLRSAAKRPAPRDKSNERRVVTDLVQYGNLAQAILFRETAPGSGTGTKMYFGLQLLKSNGRWTIVSLAYYSDRTEGQTSDRTLDAMGITPAMTIGEIGAGDGRFTIPLVRRVGPGGKIYANDIDKGALGRLAARARRLGLENVETVIGTTDDPLLPKGSLDIAVMVWVFHHLEKPVALLKNLAPSLKPGASVVILDPAPDRGGERDSDRPSTAESVAREAAEAGFELVRTETFLPKDNIFLLKRRQPVAGR